MAPSSLKTVGELASQLSQEFGDRDSQILRLEAENARLRALLEAATLNNPNSTTTNATSDVEPRSRGVTAETRKQSEDTLVDEACDVTEVEGNRSRRFPEIASGRVNNTRRAHSSFRYQNPSSDDDEDPIPLPKKEKEKAPLTAAAKNASARTSHLGATAAAGANKRKRAPPTFVHPASQASQENETRPAERSRPPLAASSGLKEIPTTNKQTPTKKHNYPPHAYMSLQKSPFQNPKHATPPPPPRKNQQSSSFRYPGSSDGRSEDVSKDNNTTRPSQPKRPKQQKNQPQPTNTATKHGHQTNLNLRRNNPLHLQVRPLVHELTRPLRRWSPRLARLRLGRAEIQNVIFLEDPRLTPQQMGRASRRGMGLGGSEEGQDAREGERREWGF
jgi:hypothetical protein